MKPTVTRHSDAQLLKLGEGSQLKIIFDSENGAQNFAMGWVSFEPGSQTPPHTRQAEEVIYVTKGEASIVTDENTYLLKPGDTILIPAGVEHYHKNAGNEIVEQLYIFSPQGPEKPLRDLPLVE